MNTVKVWKENITIPTYEVSAADKNPMFLEKRVYQGSSGKVYPHPVNEAISDEKIDKVYKAIFLENDYLQIMILPEIGGRIQRALDKTNNYDFVYYNHVIKPALVGLAGPWISGGIEFNWPQHHRPSTYDPVDYKIVENNDGSKTVWVSEIEKMYHTKGMAGFTLYPDKAYLEIKGQLYNPTDTTQTFLWWANPAVPVNENTQSIFPPDVHAVMDHGKRDVSKFPIATGTYYKMDYSEGVDISRYKNIPVPTSYMAYHSDFNFIGNYDHGLNAGLLHVADHHVNPGKKQWTWGCGDFGKAWDRNLTDDDGPYIELMTGIFTDNQPDFSFLAPYEEKTFTQYFMPYKDVGAVKNATIDAAINLEVVDGFANISAYTTSVYNNSKIILRGKNETYIEDIANLSPVNTYKKSIAVHELDTDLTLTVLDENNNVLVSYTPIEKRIERTPDPAEAALLPSEIKTTEELYLTAVHLEQYRHATYSPEPYYIEGLKRDEGDSRLNNGYGKFLYKNGAFEKSIPYFEKAIKRLTWKNPNPVDGEALYNLGLAQRMVGNLTKAFDSFYKSTWNTTMQDAAFYQLATLSCINNDYATALEFIDKSLVRNYHNLKARTLKMAILRKLNKPSMSLCLESINIDNIDYGSRLEMYMLEKNQANLDELKSLMRDDSHNYIELSLNYAVAGFYDEAVSILELFKDSTDPMLHYYMAYYKYKNGDEYMQALNHASMCDSAYCFPNRLYDICVFEFAINADKSDSMAPYYLGNLLYDKGQWERAVTYFELSVSIKNDFPTVHRNLSLAYFNKLHDAEKALAEMETAFSLDEKDSRVFLELEQLYKRLNYPISTRLENMKAHLDLVETRDTLYTEYITLLNLNHEYETALEKTSTHIFHPWEGGEGKITAQYRMSHIEIAKKSLSNNNIDCAISHLKTALTFPLNLGEGKLIGQKDNDIYYLLGIAYEKLGNTEMANENFILSSLGNDTLDCAMYYNDQPPEMFFYQALADMKLGKKVEAFGKFNKLIDYGENHIFDNVAIDYFAVSLPDFLIYEADLDEKNYVHCCYLIALGKFGLGEYETSISYFEKGLALDTSHVGLHTHLILTNTYHAFI